ncbi:MAG: type II toxin-antitoxin system tRNA(fMet)-specific endonuclease VapC [Acetobacteraceae bacterium]
MLTHMLDTNICIYVMKNRPSNLLGKFNALAGQLCISGVALGELYFGVEKSDRRAENLRALEGFTARLAVLPFDDRAALHFGQLRWELERNGTVCGAYDMQIGAHARGEGLILVTNNMREFSRMPGLRTENWL